MCQPPWEAPDPGTVEDWSDMHAGLTLALSPEERVEPESSKLLIMALSFWWPAPILKLCRSQGSPQCCKVFYHADDFIECGRSESRLSSKTSIRIKCVTRHLLIRDLWGWGSLCQGPGPETKCVLLSVTHCLRHWLPWKKPGRKTVRRTASDAFVRRSQSGTVHSLCDQDAEFKWYFDWHKKTHNFLSSIPLHLMYSRGKLAFFSLTFYWDKWRAS